MSWTKDDTSHLIKIAAALAQGGAPDAATCVRKASDTILEAERTLVDLAATNRKLNFEINVLKAALLRAEGEPKELNHDDHRAAA
jgi:hypothetical protein